MAGEGLDPNAWNRFVDTEIYKQGVDFNSPLGEKLVKALGSPEAAVDTLARANEPTFDAFIGEAARRYPEDTVGWDFEANKTNYLVQAIKDVWADRDTAWSSKYVDIDIDKDAPHIVAGKHALGMLNISERLMYTPYAAAMGAMVEIGNSYGMNSTQTTELYNTMMENLPGIAITGGVVQAGAGLAGLSTKLKPRIAKFSQKIRDYVHKGAITQTQASQMTKAVERGAFRLFVDRARGAMVTMPVTTMRNTLNVAARGGIDAMVDSLEYTTGKMANFYRKKAAKALGVKYTPVRYNVKTGRQIGSSVRGMTRYTTSSANRKLTNDLINNNPKELDNFMSRYVGDLDRGVGGKMVDDLIDVANTLNWKQEVFHRKASLIASLDRQLIARGFKGGYDDLLTDPNVYTKLSNPGVVNAQGKTQMQVMLNQAANDALYQTFAKELDGNIPKAIMSMFRGTIKDPQFKWLNKVGLGLQATGIPYPRFMLNSLAHMYDLSPHHLFKVFKLVNPSASFHAADTRALAGGATGTILMGMFAALEDFSGGDRWYNATIMGKQVDMRAFLGPYAPFALMGSTVNRAKDGRLTPGRTLELMGEFFDSAVNLPNGYELGIPQFSQALSKVVEAVGDEEAGTILNDIMAGRYEQGTIKAANDLSAVFSNVAAKILTPFKFASDVMATAGSATDTDWLKNEGKVKEIYKGDTLLNFKPFLNNIPVLRQLLPDKYEPTRAGPKEYSAPWFKHISGLTHTPSNWLESKLKRELGYSDKKIKGYKTGVFKYDYFMSERMGQYMESVGSWLSKDPLVMVSIGKDYDAQMEINGEMIPPVPYSNLSKADKMRFVEDIMTWAREAASNDVKSYLTEQGDVETLQEISKRNMPLSQRKQIKEKGLFVMPSEEATRSPKIIREQVGYEGISPIAPSHKFKPIN